MDRYGDQDTVLSHIREAVAEWRDAPPASAAGDRAANRLIVAFTVMDERLSAGGDLPADWDIAPEGPAWLTCDVLNDIRAHVAAGHRIAAIKAIRTASSMGLKEAKDWLDERYPPAYRLS